MTAEERAALCRRIASGGGNTTVLRHGRFWMAAIGKAGAKVTIERHGFDYFSGIVKRKGWKGKRTPSLAVDLAAGKFLAEEEEPF